jgi:hypothetical protein
MPFLSQFRKRYFVNKKLQQRFSELETQLDEIEKTKRSVNGAYGATETIDYGFIPFMIMYIEDIVTSKIRYPIPFALNRAIGKTDFLKETINATISETQIEFDWTADVYQSPFVSYTAYATAYTRTAWVYVYNMELGREFPDV